MFIFDIRIRPFFLAELGLKACSFDLIVFWNFKKKKKKNSLISLKKNVSLPMWKKKLFFLIREKWFWPKEKNNKQNKNKTAPLHPPHPSSPENRMVGP